MKKHSTLFLIPILGLGITTLSSCNNNYDAKLVVYNWEDYIYTGTDELGNIIDEEGGIVERFEKYISEKTGKKIKVDYQTFATNEIMYQQISLGSITPDLICPSDYMIQKMANEDMLEQFPYNEETKQYDESLSNWSNYGSPYIKERFEKAKVQNGKSFLTYSVPYFWGTMGFIHDPEFFAEEEISS